MVGRADYRLAGAIGTCLYLGFTFYLICAGGLIDHGESMGSKHNLLQLLLYMFVLCHLAYYAMLTWVEQHTTFIYFTHILASYFLAIAFVVFSTMWTDAMTLNLKWRKRYWWASVTVNVLYSAVTGNLLFWMAMLGYEDTVGRDKLSYEAYIATFPVLILLVSFGFLCTCIRLLADVLITYESSEQIKILKNLRRGMVCCTLCGVLQTVMLLLLFVDDPQDLQLLRKLNVAVYYLLEQWLPNSVLLVLMLIFTKRTSATQQRRDTASFSFFTRSHHPDRVRFAAEQDYNSALGWESEDTSSPANSFYERFSEISIRIPGHTHTPAMASQRLVGSPIIALKAGSPALSRSTISIPSKHDTISIPSKHDTIPSIHSPKTTTTNVPKESPNVPKTSIKSATSTAWPSRSVSLLPAVLPLAKEKASSRNLSPPTPPPPQENTPLIIKA